MIKHVNDPTYFYDAIEEFSFNYVIYVESSREIDEYGNTHITYSKETIRGSLQPEATRLNQSLKGNTTSSAYNFYCKSLYRINIGDIIYDNNQYLRVNSVANYDAWGCRQASLEMIQLNEYRDLAEYVKFLSGIKYV